MIQDVTYLFYHTQLLILNNKVHTQHKRSFYSRMKKVKGNDWWLFFKAVYWTGIARILIVFIPLKRFAFILGSHMKETPEASASEYLELLQAVELAISRASRYVPWRCKCYEQAISAKIILRGFGIETTLYYGVAKDQEQKLIAHAWVRCGDYIVTGRLGMKRFTVVGTFA